MTLEFDEATHTYRKDGRTVPNVTRIISPLIDLSMIPQAVLEHARAEGVAIHKTVELACLGTLDVDALMTDEEQAWLRPYYQAWLRFVDDTGFELWDSEQRVYHDRLNYAGTLDLAGLMPKLKTADGGCLLDLKRSFHAGAAIGVQLAAYEEARNRSVPKHLRTSRRYGLQLRSDGTYRLQPFEDRDDFGAFLACLALNRWNERKRA